MSLSSLVSTFPVVSPSRTVGAQARLQSCSSPSTFTFGCFALHPLGRGGVLVARGLDARGPDARGLVARGLVARKLVARRLIALGTNATSLTWLWTSCTQPSCTQPMDICAESFPCLLLRALCDVVGVPISVLRASFSTSHATRHVGYETNGLRSRLGSGAPPSGCMILARQSCSRASSPNHRSADSQVFPSRPGSTQSEEKALVNTETDRMARLLLGILTTVVCCL